MHAQKWFENLLVDLGLLYCTQDTQDGINARFCWAPMWEQWPRATGTWSESRSIPSEQFCIFRCSIVRDKSAGNFIGDSIRLEF
jgi:hypothetical protein